MLIHNSKIGGIIMDLWQILLIVLVGIFIGIPAYLSLGRVIAQRFDIDRESGTTFQIAWPLIGLLTLIVYPIHLLWENKLSSALPKIITKIKTNNIVKQYTAFVKFAFEWFIEELSSKQVKQEKKSA